MVNKLKKLCEVGEIKHDVYQSTENKHFQQLRSNYYDKFFNVDQEARYILFMENPLSFESYIFNPEAGSKDSPYISSIQSAFDLSAEDNRLEDWQKNFILPIDIYQFLNQTAGIDLGTSYRNNSLRKGLSTLMIDNCPYPVFRFLLAIEYINSLEFKFSKNLKIAFMMPIVTSTPIFNYFGRNNEINVQIGNVNVADQIRFLNNLPYYENNLESKLIPRHKINTIGGANTPDPDLLRLALDF